MLCELGLYPSQKELVERDIAPDLLHKFMCVRATANGPALGVGKASLHHRRQSVCHATVGRLVPGALLARVLALVDPPPPPQPCQAHAHIPPPPPACLHAPLDTRIGPHLPPLSVLAKGEVMGSSAFQQLMERALRHNHQADGATQRLGDYVTAFFNSNSETLRMIDPSVSVEMGFFLHFYGCGAKDMLHWELKEVLPLQGRVVSVMEVLAEVDRLQQHPAYISCGGAAKSEVNIVSGWIEALRMGNPPSFKGIAADDKLVSMQGRVALLVKVEVTNGEEATMLHLVHLAKGISGSSTAGVRVSLSDLKVFDAYSWLLSDAEKASS